MTVPVSPRRGEAAPPEEFRQFEGWAKDLLTLRVACIDQGADASKLAARLDAAIARLPLVDLDQAGAPASRADVLLHLGMLLKCYPVGAQDAKVFGALLIDDVMDLTPQSAAVAIACRRCRASHKFMPSIAEVLEEVRAAKSLVSGAVEFARRIEAERDRLRNSD